ncbi:MAG: tryptophan 7-halogenase [Planctomycetota bacterium]|jgi:hypothetical protein
MKLTIIGRGNAGCITAMYFSHFRNYLDTPLEIELIYDSNIMPVPTGQGTALEFTDTMTRCFDSSYIDKFPSTIKTGIMYENWGTKNKKIFHHFPIGSYALHFEPSNFQDFVCDNLKVNFKEIDENVQDYSEIDSDYIIDCRGAPKNLNNYELLVNPLNCALLSTLPKKENDVEFTKAIAHKNGWCFYIPLPDKTSIGYMFNNKITDTKDAEKDFIETFGVEKINKIFPFNNYVAKNPIVDERVFLNGNKLFFLEPLEATAMSCYVRACNYYFDYMFKKVDKKVTTDNLKNYFYQIQNIILWHYATGSVFNTSFWDYAKKLWDNHEKNEFEQIINIVKNASDKDLEKSRKNSIFVYGTFQEWNFKNWIDGTL